MRKFLFILTVFFTLSACQNNEEEIGSPAMLYFTIQIVDIEGNDLLDPTAAKNIVSQKPTLIDISGKERPSDIYTNNSFDYNQGKGFLLIDKWNNNGKTIHYMIPGGPYGYSKTPKHWFNNAKVIVKWGEGIANDTIVFSGGWEDTGAALITRVTINGKELKRDESFWHEKHFIYVKETN